MKQFAITLTILTGCNTTHPDPPLPDAPPEACPLGPFERLPNPLQLGDGSNLTGNIAADPSVIYENGMYRIWFTAYDETLGLHAAYAESQDGRIVDRVVNPVLTRDAQSPKGVETVSVVRGPDGLVMLYTQDLADQLNARIGLATSQDGIVWTRHPAPVLEPELPWELPVCFDETPDCQKLGGVLEPSLHYDAAANEYRLWYAALGKLDDVFAFRIGAAQSTDAIHWTREPLPVLSPDAGFDSAIVSHPNVIAVPGGFHLFYFGATAEDDQACNGCPLTPGKLGHAFSHDGVSWTREPAPILSPSGFTAWSIGGPFALLRDDRLELFYFGTPNRDATEIHIGLATAAAPAPCQ